MNDTDIDILPIYKYTKREWAEDFLQRGRIYVSTASSLNDPSLNAAIRDDELVVNAITNDSTTKVFLGNQETLETEKQIPTIGDIEFTLELAKPVDYYVMCFSMECNRHTLAQFEHYDTCVAIGDHVRFVRAVYSEFERFTGRWRCVARPVEYYQPRSINRLPETVFFHKDQTYAYQQEYRIVLYPNDAYKKLESMYIEIGSLEHYCEIIEFD